MNNTRLPFAQTRTWSGQRITLWIDYIKNEIVNLSDIPMYLAERRRYAILAYFIFRIDCSPLCRERQCLSEDTDVFEKFTNREVGNGFFKGFSLVGSSLTWHFFFFFLKSLRLLYIFLSLCRHYWNVPRNEPKGSHGRITPPILCNIRIQLKSLRITIDYK